MTVAFIVKYITISYIFITLTEFWVVQISLLTKKYNKQIEELKRIKYEYFIFIFFVLDKIIIISKG